MRPGPRNLITDVAGLRVGNAENDRIRTGVTVLTARMPFTAAVHVMGGAPGTRETDLLAPDRLVEKVDALVLAGGSAHGLDAAGGVTAALRAEGRGYPAGPVRVPIVPAAILFDLANGGDKEWGECPYTALGRDAYSAAADDFALGTAGAGAGCVTATLKGGLGSASAVLEGGVTVGALAAVNCAGAVTIDEAGRFWAAPFEFGDEFGGLGAGTPSDPSRRPAIKGFDPDGGGGGAREATTLAIVATDAALTKAQATRMAVAAHDGLARAIVPAHTPIDGDLVFAVATGARPLADPVAEPLLIGHAAACCLARAVARGVYAAMPTAGDTKPTWSERFGSG
ncbi:MAG: P1 family peptidase [Paracoccaceae bacterium]|jgi:D-aminopeptidase|nr:P1 family peptidase [Paracoccaceae bacterium]